MMQNNKKIDKNFEKVTKVNVILTIIENIVFFVIGRWNHTVLIGSLWGLALTCIFFYMICVSVPRALAMEDPDLAAKHMRTSQLERTRILGVGIFVAIKAPFIYWPAALIPLLFTRISISVLHLEREEE